eukprot:5337895-Pleurochrysis_carterae.AAC.2
MTLLVTLIVRLPVVGVGAIYTCDQSRGALAATARLLRGACKLYERVRDLRAEAPENATVGARIATVESEAVIQMQRRGECCLRRARPKEQRLAPRHAQVVVQLARVHKQLLSCVPHTVAALTPLERMHVYQFRPRVVRVQAERALRPVWKRSKGTELVVPVVAEGISKLSPDEKLVGELARASGTSISGKGKR